MRHAAAAIATRVFAAACLGLLPVELALASGPVERIAEVLSDPTDPSTLVARYGQPGSNRGAGLLFSRDGGKTFKASCADFIAPEMSLNSSESLYNSQLHMDAEGRLLATGFIDQVFVGDATGCSFVQEPFESTRGASFAADPSDPRATLMFAYRRNDANKEHARAYILRRGAEGNWADVSEVHKERAANEDVFPADLIATKLPSGALRMAVHYNIYEEDVIGDRLHVATSDDGGATFTSHPLTLADEDANFRLIGFDPANPDRIIALEYGEARVDKLVLSTDGGKTFEPWFEVDEFSGITYVANGKVFVSSTSDDKIAGSTGGLFAASKVGDPLTKIPGSTELDCIHYRASDEKLVGCYLDKIGLVDANSGVFTPVTRMLDVKSLIECPGKDAKKSCEKQLAGTKTAWCCVGHFPWTPFCGDYSFPDRGTPICGKQAQEYACREFGECGNERSDGGTSTPQDGGVSGRVDAGGPMRDAASGDAENPVDDKEAPGEGSRARGEGCSCSARGAGGDASSTLLLVGLAFLVIRRRCCALYARASWEGQA